MFSPWSPGRQSLHIVCVENSNCNYLLRDVCCSQAFVSILFSNILWWSWALSWAYELRECNLPECHWLCRPPPGWIIRWCLITGRDTPPGERNQIYDSGALLRRMWAVVSSWSSLTDNIGRGWLEGLAAVARTGPGLFWLTPDATLAGGQYPTMHYPWLLPTERSTWHHGDPGLFSRHRITLWDFPLMIWRPSNQLEDDFYRRSFDRRTRWTHRTSFTNHTRSKLRLCGYFYYTLSQDGQATS